MNEDRFERQIGFLLEIDRLKEIVRRTYLLSGTRRENSAEHSWHLAVAALLLAEHAAEPVDAADPSPDRSDPYFKSVFDQFVALKKSCNESIAGLTYDKFVGKLIRNRDELRAKSGLPRGPVHRVREGRQGGPQGHPRQGQSRLGAPRHSVPPRPREQSYNRE